MILESLLKRSLNKPSACTHRTLCLVLGIDGLEELSDSTTMTELIGAIVSLVAYSLSRQSCDLVVEPVLAGPWSLSLVAEISQAMKLIHNVELISLPMRLLRLHEMVAVLNGYPNYQEVLATGEVTRLLPCFHGNPGWAIAFISDAYRIGAVGSSRDVSRCFRSCLKKCAKTCTGIADCSTLLAVAAGALSGMCFRDITQLSVDWLTVHNSGIATYEEVELQSAMPSLSPPANFTPIDGHVQQFQYDTTINHLHQRDPASHFFYESADTNPISSTSRVDYLDDRIRKTKVKEPLHLPIQVPYVLLYAVVQAAQSLEAPEINNNEKMFVRSLKGMHNHLRESARIHFDWSSWEVFGAQFYAARINAFVVLGRTSVEVRELWRGGRMNDSVASIRVCLQTMEVFHVREKMMGTMNHDLQEGRGSFKTARLTSCRHIFLNGQGGEGFDIIFALKKENLTEDELIALQAGDPFAGILVITDQRKRWYNTMSSKTMEKIIKHLKRDARLPNAHT